MSKPSKKKRSSQWGNIAIISLLLLCIAIGFAMLLPSYFEESEQKVEITQDVVAFKEMVSQYRPSDASEGIDETEEETIVPTPGVLKEYDEKYTPSVYPELWQAMREYNQDIYENGQSELVDAWSYQQEVVDLSDYGYYESAIGVVYVPDISVEMPLYLGASSKNMNKGFAQMSQTSMPIGGENTNCVIVGHRGWNGLPFMRDVEQLEIGDFIYVENPWEVLAYRIDEILLIKPNEVETILLQEGRDLLSIVTCHPYGNGTHRYVLICERYYPEVILDEVGEVVGVEKISAPDMTGSWVWEWQDRVNITATSDLEFESSQMTIFVAEYLPWLLLVLAVLLLVIAIFTIVVSELRKRKRRKA